MERESNFKQFVDGLLKLGKKVLHQSSPRPTQETFILFPNEEHTRIGFNIFLRKQLESFGGIDGEVRIEDIASLVGTMSHLPPADNLMGYPFSQLTGDLQIALFSNPVVRSATINWFSQVHKGLIYRHESLKRETKEWEEELDQPDLEFRGLTAEAGRQIRSTENAIKLLGGTYDSLINT